MNKTKRIRYSNREEEFLKRLKELLSEFNASIVWNCSDSSDLHGIYRQRMEFCIGNNDPFLAASGNWITENNITSHVETFEQYDER